MKTRTLGLGLVSLTALVLAGCGGNSNPNQPGQSSRTSTTVSPSTTTPATVPPTTTRSTAVPQAVKAESVTFVSNQVGWVLGTVNCPSDRKAVRTGAAAHHQRWDIMGTGRRPAGPHGQPVRFADADDGWMWDADSGPDGLWSTHDGGLTGRSRTFPSRPPGLPLGHRGGRRRGVCHRQREPRADHVQPDRPGRLDPVPDHDPDRRRSGAQRADRPAGTFRVDRRSGPHCRRWRSPRQRLVAALDTTLRAGRRSGLADR